MYYLLLYDVVDQFTERHAPYRDAHLKSARTAADNGELLLAGAFADPADDAVFTLQLRYRWFRVLAVGQVLEDQGILGRTEIAERHLVRRKLPEVPENPLVVNLRSAWQPDLLNFPAAGLADCVADLPGQSLFGVVLKARRDASVQIGPIGTFSTRPSWLTASSGHSLIRTRMSGIGQAW